jgi:hypothetical protein
VIRKITAGVRSLLVNDDSREQPFLGKNARILIAELHQVRLPAEEDPLIHQHLAKYDKLYPTLALILAFGRRLLPVPSTPKNAPPRAAWKRPLPPAA